MEANKTECQSEHRPSKAERMFESALWNSRFVVLIAVIASMITAFGIFYLTSVDIFYTISHLAHYHEMDDAGRALLKAQTVAHVVGSVDGFLLGAIMLIFSLGLYELFISKIDIAESQHGASNILFISSLDDLKDRLAKVIVLILIVMFFEQAIFLKPTEPLELLYYALAIMMVALALYLSHKAYH
ncbi:YqhA family protein [Thiomicrorhabdus sp. ZW0627]|uniref:YqhA family protein n=1 Tax=Thiomicrorhabdus sp. ZW0627 TaxID=3039774 RepID=UPI002436FE15|nr:YqhA family protein [Thiomicrorhabdus sp. ZW0627]MDG6773641.1 YqhA family protein [Thiomicrorhabdus sp. ZW0627]